MLTVTPAMSTNGNSARPQSLGMNSNRFEGYGAEEPNASTAGARPLGYRRGAGRTPAREARAVARISELLHRLGAARRRAVLQQRFSQGERLALERWLLASLGLIAGRAPQANSTNRRLLAVHPMSLHSGVDALAAKPSHHLLASSFAAANPSSMPFEPAVAGASRRVTPRSPSPQQARCESMNARFKRTAVEATCFVQGLPVLLAGRMKPPLAVATGPRSLDKDGSSEEDQFAAPDLQERSISTRASRLEENSVAVATSPTSVSQLSASDDEHSADTVDAPARCLEPAIGMAGLDNLVPAASPKQTKVARLHSWTEQSGKTWYRASVAVCGLKIQSRATQDHELASTFLNALLDVQKMVHGTVGLPAELAAGSDVNTKSFEALVTSALSACVSQHELGGPAKSPLFSYIVTVSTRCWTGGQLQTPRFSKLADALSARSRLLCAVPGCMEGAGTRTDLAMETDSERETSWARLQAAYIAVCADAGRDPCAVASRLAGLRKTRLRSGHHPSRRRCSALPRQGRGGGLEKVPSVVQRLRGTGERRAIRQAARQERRATRQAARQQWRRLVKERAVEWRLDTLLAAWRRSKLSPPHLSPVCDTTTSLALTSHTVAGARTFSASTPRFRVASAASELFEVLLPVKRSSPAVAVPERGSSGSLLRCNLEQPTSRHRLRHQH